MFLLVENIIPGKVRGKTLKVGCANKDLDRSLGSLGKFIDYCRMVALLPAIPYTQRNNW